EAENQIIAILRLDIYDSELVVDFIRRVLLCSDADYWPRAYAEFVGRHGGANGKGVLAVLESYDKTNRVDVECDPGLARFILNSICANAKRERGPIAATNQQELARIIQSSAESKSDPVDSEIQGHLATAVERTRHQPQDHVWDDFVLACVDRLKEK